MLSSTFALVLSAQMARRAIVRAFVTGGILLLLTWSVAAAQGAVTPRSTLSLQQLLDVEDSRTSDPDSVRILTDALADKNAELRARAARALGRFERAAFIPALVPRVSDSDRQVRMQTVNAIAQIVKGQGRALDPSLFNQVLDALIPALVSEPDPEVVGVIARSLGRIARNDGSGARVQQAIASLLVAGGRVTEQQQVAAADPRTLFGVVHAKYALSRIMRPPVGQPPTSPGALELGLLRYGIGGAPPSAVRNRKLATEIRRLALLTVTNPGVRADRAADIAIRDPDDQMRRLAVLATANATDSSLRRSVLALGLIDGAFIVRFEAVRSWRRFFAGECLPLVAATRDRNPQVMLAAIDALGGCSDIETARGALQPLARPAPASPARAAGKASWHVHAHALVSLARIDASRAGAIVRDDATHPVWQVRMYAARAAAITRDTATLARLAFDSVGGVREAAIDGLASTSGHGVDMLYVRALSSDEHHVVLAAAKALKGTSARDSALPSLIAVLDRLTRMGNDNSRDPRMEVLQRIAELGDVSLASRIEPYARDFDVAIAERAAAIISQWTGRAVAANPRRLERVSPDLARVASASDVRMRFTMSPSSGGGTFVVRLRTNATPATSERLIALAERGYYNGLTFHRVEPTFVIQGGSPRATEYVGDGAFMRDEVDLASHTRGTMGISTRGRDTGDAQIFVNLTDNFRLDHDYTVVGDVIEGMGVVDGVLEGDVIARVSVTGVQLGRAGSSGRK